MVDCVLVQQQPTEKRANKQITVEWYFLWRLFVAWTLSRFSARAQVPWPTPGREGPWERAEKRLGVQASLFAPVKEHSVSMTVDVNYRCQAVT